MIHRAPGLLMSAMLSGCMGPVPLSETPLSEVPVALASGWRYDAAFDPLPEHQPEIIDCPEGAFGEELGIFEVQTGVCDYLLVYQETLEAISAGDVLSGSLWHQGLDAPSPAVAHAALSIGGEVVWEITANIPSEAEIWSFSVPIESGYPEGSPLSLHLHNHGYNSWRLSEIARISETR